MVYLILVIIGEEQVLQVHVCWIIQQIKATNVDHFYEDLTLKYIFDCLIVSDRLLELWSKPFVLNSCTTESPSSNDIKLINIFKFWLEGGDIILLTVYFPPDALDLY